MDAPAPNWARRRRLGRGSFAAVDLAAALPSGRLFAVKSVEHQASSAVAVLEHEISLLKALSSPYIVQYIADDVTSETSPAGEVRWFRNMHMEYVAGGTAAEAGAMEERRVRSVARRVVLALEYLHSMGIVHGDVKGRNVLLGPPAKLADFGSAVSLSDERPLSIRGTPLWMAPEIARGESPSPAADIWSLGCTVIEMFTGRAPRRCRVATSAATPVEAIYLIGYSGDPPEIPKALSELGKDFLSKCLTLESGGRSTAKELLHHPFLAEAEEAREWSPRSVLDTIISEFEDYPSSSCSSSSCYNNNPTQKPNSSQETSIQLSAKCRIKKLACADRIQEWESEGWELVRGPPAPDSKDDEVQRWEYSELSTCCSSEETADSCCSDACEEGSNSRNVWCLGELCKEPHCEHCGCGKGLLAVGSDTYSSLLSLPPTSSRHVFMAKDYCQLQFYDDKIFN